MPYVSEDRVTETQSQVSPSGTTSYKESPRSSPIIFHHSDILRTGGTVRAESQYGYRTRPGSGKTREPDLPPTNKNWSDSASLVRHLDEIEMVTSTSPRPARGSYAVNSRVHLEETTGSVVLPVPMSYNYLSEDRRSWDWTCNAAVYFNLLDYIPPSSRMASSDEPDWSKVLRDMRPTKSHGELANFVAELGDAPRSVATAAANVKRQELSQGPINYQFGIAPVISDIKSLAKSVSRSGGITNNFVRQSGRAIRRKRSWSDSPEIRTYSFAAGLSAPRLSTPRVDIYARVDLTRTITRTYRAGGAYQYYVADPTGFLPRAQRYRQMADHLLGTNFDASTFWELTPWSWLVDWSVDIGGLISYQEDVVDDSLVLRGGFHVVETKVVDTYVVSFRSPSITPSLNLSLPPPQAVHVVSYAHEKRDRSSPYGWSPSAEVTPRRSAILAALGLARAAN